MIDPRDLRVGNWIKYNSDSSLKPELINTDVKVTADVIKWASNPSENCYDPIPLTPEILESCGFEKIEGKLSLKILEGYVFISFMFNLFPLVLDIDGHRMPLHKIKYLHQLQNLYHSLTGMELEINLSLINLVSEN